MEHRITVTMPVVDELEQELEQLIDGFVQTHPEAGPVGAANLEQRTMSISYSVDAEDFQTAWAAGASIFSEGMAAASLSDRQLLRGEVEAVEAEEAHEAELQLA
jgi:hypothetical protein